MTDINHNNNETDDLLSPENNRLIREQFGADFNIGDDSPARSRGVPTSHRNSSIIKYITEPATSNRKQSLIASCKQKTQKNVSVVPPAKSLNQTLANERTSQSFRKEYPEYYEDTNNPFVMEDNPTDTYNTPTSNCHANGHQANMSSTTLNSPLSVPNTVTPTMQLPTTTLQEQALKGIGDARDEKTALLNLEKQQIWQALQYKQLWNPTNQSYSLPTINFTNFPECIVEPILTISTSFNVSQDFVFTSLLATISGCCRGKISVRRNKNHNEQLSLFFLNLLPPGMKKSLIQETMSRPIKEYQETQAEKHDEVVRKNKIQQRLIKKQIKLLEKNISNNGSFSDEDISKISQLEQQMPQDNYSPNYLLFNCTPEGLEQEMQRQGGAITVFGSEAGFLKNLSSKKNDLILLAREGEPYRRAKAKKQIVIEKPSLTISIAAQPKAVEKFLKNPLFQEDGCLSRFLIAHHNKPCPPAMTTELPEATSSWLTGLLHSLLKFSTETNAQQALILSEEAKVRWNTFDIEIQQHENINYPEVIKGFYRKLSGTALRLAGVLHVASEPQWLETPISEALMANAIDLARYFEMQSIQALNFPQQSFKKTLCDIIRTLKQHGVPEYPLRDLYRKHTRSRSEIEKYLQVLTQANIIAIHKHRTTETCIIHPCINLLTI